MFVRIYRRPNIGRHPTASASLPEIMTVGEPDRDRLALVRTDLANERTLLAYGRTALMMAATGVTIIKFFADTAGILWAGGTLIVLAAVIAGVGTTRFVSLRRQLHR